MNIGIFGDSYATKDAESKTIWWQILAQDYNHDVISYGESASSLLFSAKKILDLYQDFDLVIWVTTQPGRFSLEWKGHDEHFQIAGGDFDDNDLQYKFEIWKKWYIEVMNWEDEKLIELAVIEMVRHRCPNLLILPGFPEPLNSTFNLFSIFQQEVEMLYGGKFSDDFFQEYEDYRVGHLSQQSHEILASLLSKNLHPGIFYADLNNFPKYHDPYFVKKIYI